MGNALKILLCPCGTKSLLLSVSYWCLVMRGAVQSSVYGRFVVFWMKNLSWMCRDFDPSGVPSFLHQWNSGCGSSTWEGRGNFFFFSFIELWKFVYSQTLHELSWTQNPTFSAGILAERFPWPPPAVPGGTAAPQGRFQTLPRTPD